jgi:hypothetical protein
VGVELDAGVGNSRVGVVEGADVGVTVHVGGKVTGRMVTDSEWDGVVAELVGVCDGTGRVIWQAVSPHAARMPATNSARAGCCHLVVGRPAGQRMGSGPCSNARSAGRKADWRLIGS